MEKPIKKRGDSIRFVSESYACDRQADELHHQCFTLGLRIKNYEKWIIQNFR